MSLRATLPTNTHPTTHHQRSTTMFSKHPIIAGIVSGILTFGTGVVALALI